MAMFLCKNCSNCSRLPNLAQLARQVLCIQVTSASSERVFSHAGNIVTSSRMNLSVEKTEQLIYVHDNYERVRNDVAAKFLNGTDADEDDDYSEESEA